MAFLEAWKIVLIIMIAILRGRLATSCLLKTKVFWKKDYDVVISFHDATSKTFSHESNYIVDVAIWWKFGNSSISMWDDIITKIL